MVAPNRSTPPLPSAMADLETLDADGNTWVRKDGQWVPKPGVTIIEPEPAPVDIPLTQEELDNMWAMDPEEFNEWRSKQTFKNQCRIFVEEKRQDEAMKLKLEEVRARKEARRAQNPLWGTFT